MSHSYYEPPEYDDEALWMYARDRLEEEWKDLSTPRVENYLASLELQDVAYRLYRGEQSAFESEIERLKNRFIERYVDSEMDRIVEENEIDAAEAYADYLEDR
jgi:hypothetical protein